MNEEKIGMYNIEEIYETLTENVEGSFLNRSMVDAMIFEIKDLQQENQQLKKQIEIKDKWCQLIIDLGIDYDGYTQSDSLKLLIDDLVNYASNSIKADDKTTAYTNGLSNYNILEEEIGDNNE